MTEWLCLFSAFDHRVLRNLPRRKWGAILRAVWMVPAKVRCSACSLAILDSVVEFMNKTTRISGVYGLLDQDNALIDRMTSREILNLFRALRVLSRELTSAIVDRMIELVDLMPHANRLTRTYCNKCKVSIAVAIVGNLRLLYPDESTAGVYPIAERNI